MDGGVRSRPTSRKEDALRDARVSNRRMVSHCCIRAAGQRWSLQMDVCLLLSCLLLLFSCTANATTTSSPSSSSSSTSSPSSTSSSTSSPSSSSSSTSSPSSSSSSTSSPSSTSSLPGTSPTSTAARTTTHTRPTSPDTTPATPNSTTATTLSGDPTLNSTTATTLSGDPTLNSTTATTLSGESTLNSTTATTLSGDRTLNSTTATTLSGDTALNSTTATTLSGDPTLNSTTTGHGTASWSTATHPDRTASNTPTTQTDFYYWMVLHVDVMRRQRHEERNESHVTEWLKKAFLAHLDTCDTPGGLHGNVSTPAPSVTPSQPTAVPTITTATTTSTSTVAAATEQQTVISNSSAVTSATTPFNGHLISHQTTIWPLNFTTTYTTLSENSTKNGTDGSVFQGIDVCCEEKENISQTVCVVMVKLSAPRSPCCFRYALWNSSLTGAGPIYSSIQHNTVTLIRGMRPDTSSPPPSGDTSNCNSSESSSTSCTTSSTSSTSSSTSSTTSSSNSTTSSSVTCPRQDPRPDSSADDCSNEFRELSGLCNCSQSCGSVQYYSMGMTINNPSITQTNISAMVKKLNQSSIHNCSSSDSTCQAVKAISKVYQNSRVVCQSGNSVVSRGCRVILELRRGADRCTVNTTLSYLLNQSGITITNQAKRIAVCVDAEAGDAADLLWGNVTLQDTWQSVNFNSRQLCQLAPAALSIITCQPGKPTIVVLRSGCGGSGTGPNPPGPSVPPPTPTPTPTRTSPNVSTATPVSSATTTSAGGGPSNSTGHISPAPATNGSTTNTHTSPGAPNSTTNTHTSAGAPNSTITTTSAPASAVTNSSSVSTVPTATPGSQAPTTAAGNSSAEARADELLALTQDASSLNSSQVEQLVSQLEVLLSGPNVSLALGRTSVNIANNLLNASAAAVASSSTRLIRITDTVGLKLEVSGETESFLFDSLALAVSRVDGTNFRETTISIADPTNLQIVPRVKRSVSWVEGRAKPPQGSITLPSTLTDQLSQQQQQEASRVLFNFYQRSTFFQDTSLGTLNSGILSTSVANLSIRGLQDNITITLKNNNPIPENRTLSCAFWDFTRNDGSGGWNTNGCSVVNFTDEQTICSCSHLTSFGILLDPSRGEDISRLQATILSYITYIGCGLSAIFLSVTLLTYLSFGKLRKDIPSKILIQLCFALLLLNLVFLLDAWLALYTDAVGLCISTAFFLHYFLLASFTWMGLEAVHMYIALVKVFNSYISRFMLKFSLVGWGVPLIVVIIVIAIDKDNYGLVSYGRYEDGSTDEFCWLRNDVAFYVAVVAYFGVIFLVNLAMFVVVLVQLRRIKRQNPQNLQHRSRLQDARSIAGLTVLLGLTWGFAFFAWGPVNLAFMYLFAIFNTLQGFFIFVFHCAVKENVRRQWRTYLCCGTLRLAENSDWSRTATQNKNKKSFISQSQNSSSSTTCLAPESSVRTRSTRGSPSDDRMISDTDTNSDVVQNQISSQYHNPSRSHAEWITPSSDSRGS